MPRCCASSTRRRSNSKSSAARSSWSSAYSNATRSISGRRNFTPARAPGCGRSSKCSRELIDPAVADILEQALRQELRDYYGKVFERYALRDKLRPFFERYDILLSPVLPVTSLDVGKNLPDHLGDRNLVSWVYYTYPFNLTGQPAATVCAGIAATACRSDCRSSDARSTKSTWCGRRRPTSAASRRDITCVLLSHRLDESAAARVSLPSGRASSSSIEKSW